MSRVSLFFIRSTGYSQPSAHSSHEFIHVEWFGIARRVPCSVAVAASQPGMGHRLHPTFARQRADGSHSGRGRPYTQECLALEADTSMDIIRVIRVPERLIMERGVPKKGAMSAAS